MQNNTENRLFPESNSVTRDGAPLELTLYKSDTCGYCHMVLRVVEDLRIPVRLQDTMRDAGAYETLLEKGGKTQVPCLFINGEPLYESAAIIEFFRKQVVVQPAP